MYQHWVTDDFDLKQEKHAEGEDIDNQSKYAWPISSFDGVMIGKNDISWEH